MMTNNKTIVVVEALSNGRFYIPEIEKRGYKPVVVLVPNDNGEFPPAYEHFREMTVATFFRHIPCYMPRTIDEAYDLLAQHDVAAVISGSDYGTTWTDLLARRFCCLGNNPDNTALRYLKPEMQEALRDAGLRSIQGKTVSSLNEIIDFFHQTGGEKIVLKYKASAGSVGVHFCSSVQQIEEAYRAMSTGTDFFGRNNDQILVQEYISGTEYIVNSVSCNGVHRITDIWICNKVRIGAEGNAYNYYRVVTRLEIKQVKLVNYVYKTLDALGFVYGPAHGEYFIDDQGPVLVEVGARPMGGGFSPALFTEALGHCMVDASLDSYLNPDAFEASRQLGYVPRKEYMIKYLIAPSEQEVNTLPILPLLKQMPSVREGNFLHCIEDGHIDKTIDLITAPAYVQLVHTDWTVLQRDYELIRRLENYHFDSLLSADKGSFSMEEYSDELSPFVTQTPYRKDPALLVCDVGMEPEQRGVSDVVISSDDLFSHGDRYAYVVLGFGRIANIESYYELIIRASQLLAEGGELVFCPKLIGSVPKGEVLLEIVMEILGMSSLLPLQNDSLWIKARKVASV